jgi:hypothetical protein
VKVLAQTLAICHSLISLLLEGNAGVTSNKDVLPAWLYPRHLMTGGNLAGDECRLILTKTIVIMPSIENF